jgi:hypothetical protein
MTTPLLALWLSLSGAAPAAATAPAAPPAAEAPRDWDKPPPGSKADQALWQSAHDVNTELVVQQHVAARLTQGAKGSGYQEKLPELARSGALPKARADELQARLLKAWTANLEVVQTQWPVSKVRVCGYELLNLESVMSVESRNEAQLADTRKAVADCVGRANSVLGPLKRSNEELQAALDEIGRELASLPKSAPAAFPGKAAPAPSAAATPGTATPAKAD